MREGRGRFAATAPLRGAHRIAGALLALACAAGIASGAWAADGKALFAARCAVCHTVGGGRAVGPDLKDVVARRGRDGTVAAVMNPSAAKLAPAMPNLGLTRADAEAIVTYLAGGPGAAAVPGRSASAPGRSAPVPVRAAPAVGNAERGKALFTGALRLERGAMPCIGCHSTSDVGALGGGTLATDLGDAGTRYGGADALAPLLKDVPFPAMRAVYGPRPLSDAEIADLAAYLAGQKTKPRAGATFAFFALGFLGMLILVGLSQIIWRNRLKGVRRQLAGGR